MNNLILPNGFQPTKHPRALPPDVQARMFADCLDSLSADFKPSTDKVDVALQRGMDARKAVIAEIRPLLTNPALILDDLTMQNIRQRIMSAYADCFIRWPQDDAVMLLTVLHTEMLWKKIREQVGL